VTNYCFMGDLTLPTPPLNDRVLCLITGHISRAYAKHNVSVFWRTVSLVCFGDINVSFFRGPSPRRFISSAAARGNITFASVENYIGPSVANM